MAPYINLFSVFVLVIKDEQKTMTKQRLKRLHSALQLRNNNSVNKAIISKKFKMALKLE